MTAFQPGSPAYEALIAERDELRSENKRLRAALQHITDLCKLFLADNMDRIDHRALEPKP